MRRLRKRAESAEGREQEMEWTRSDTIALAMQCCSDCHGLGLKFNLRGTSVPCNCVLRAVFRACYARFRHCASKEKHISQASLELISGKDCTRIWGRKDEEYIADFCQVSRKSLTNLSIRSSNIIFFSAPTGGCAPGSSTSTGGTSSTPSTESSRSWERRSANCSPMGCTR